MDETKKEILNYIKKNYTNMTNDNKNKVNIRIKEIRKNLKLNQVNFGKELFISQDTVSLLETGKQKPTERQLLDICLKFDINIEWLMFGIGEIYLDILKELQIDEEIKKITNDLYSLDEKDREVIKQLIKNIKEKIDNNQKES